MSIDALDRKILLALQRNGRVTNAELARELGVAPSTMLERIRKLEESKALRGFRAVVDPEALGLTVQGFVSVILSRHDTDCIRDFEQGIGELANVRACYHLTGRFDYLLHVAAQDLPHLGRIVKEKIASISGIAKAETFLVLSEVKSDGGWPIQIEQPPA
jgi:Lrp/AsnC family transcriptional regulator, leucine-responsive regulatory protein